MLCQNVKAKDRPSFSTVYPVSVGLSDRPQDIDYVFKGKTCWFY
ncbi:MAG: hypothetical protein PUI10_07470 [Prevotellaceae bacterium]|nr:hypothetical protein [Prevotellaceae bacterium]